MRWTKTLKERFFDKVDKKSKKECWLWQAAKYPSGYGIFWDGEYRTGAHRIKGKEWHERTKAF